MNYLKGGLGTSRQRDEAGELSRPLTPKSEVRTNVHINISMQTTDGLCLAGRKCVRHDGHAGDCWPL